MLPPVRARSAFAVQHARCKAENIALVVQLDHWLQLLLVPVDTQSEKGELVAPTEAAVASCCAAAHLSAPLLAADNTSQPVFWGFVLADGLPTLVAELLDRVYLALILDLDETLLIANSATTIENRMDSCRRAR